MPDIHCDECSAWAAAYDQLRSSGQQVRDHVDLRTDQLLAARAARDIMASISQADLGNLLAPDYSTSAPNPQPIPLTAASVLASALRALGADGLAGEDCGCGLDDLAPCQVFCADCVPARRVRATEPGENHEIGDMIFVSLAASSPQEPTP
jgi:hypothetical protein